MKCHFGELDESVLKALRDAYNPDANSFAESCDEGFDFKQCQRSDGTIYGSRGDCAQKGSKEVKTSQGGVGLFGATGKDNVKKASKGQLKIKSLGSQATIDLISEAAKMESASPKDRAKVVQMGYKHLTELAKGEGKKPPTLTSIVSGAQLKKIGVDPNKANVKSGSRGKDDTKIAKEKKAKAKAEADAKAKKGKALKDAKEEVRLLQEDLKQNEETLNSIRRSFRKTDAEKAAEIKQWDLEPSIKKDLEKAEAKLQALTGASNSKASGGYSYQDNRNQYKQFYNMVRNQGLGHGDAAGAAEDAMRAKGFDPGDISNQYRKEVREAF